MSHLSGALLAGQCSLRLFKPAPSRRQPQHVQAREVYTCVAMQRAVVLG